MHIVDGEHGHHHTHCECGGEHSHSHDHDHEHCGCGGEHGHDHSCGGCQGERPANEQEALVAYMLDHNKHHAAELLVMAKTLKESGKEEAGVNLEKAAAEFEKGNMYLSIALSLVKEA